MSYEYRKILLTIPGLVVSKRVFSEVIAGWP